MMKTNDRYNDFHEAVFLSKCLRNIFVFEVRHCFRWPLLSQVRNF